MAQPRNIYLLNPKKLSPETIAVAFAKTSRSPLSFNEIAAELSDEESADFHQKWVIGYGHSSVAEHAVLHIAVENLSRLAVECLESNRLASYTEKSSRYQIWRRDHFFIPPEISGTQLEKTYISLNRTLFDHYQQSVDTVRDYLAEKEPRVKGESRRSFDHRLRTCSADACRYFLPASSQANVGMSINARALEHALSKMLSHPLAEVRQIGEEIRTIARESVPTLIKYAEENDYMQSVRSSFEDLCRDLPEKKGAQKDWLACVDCDSGGQARVLAALLYRFGACGFDMALETVSRGPVCLREKIVHELLGRLGSHDIPLRELEYASVGFDLTIDQGAYFELKRHRMMTQTPQLLTPHLGFAVPSLIAHAGLAEQFKEDMEMAENVYHQIDSCNHYAASYVIPNAFNRRVMLQMNLRSALHFIKLRSAPNAHFSIRRVALRMADEIRALFPLFSDYFTPDSGETWETVSCDYFTQLV